MSRGAGAGHDATERGSALPIEVPVLICGAGPVGLAMAVELAQYGVRSLVLERHGGTSTHPRARNINTRTMEIVRGWGAAAHAGMRALNLPPGWTEQIVYTRTLGGEEFGRMRTRGFSGPGESVSPEAPLLTCQDRFEPVFLAEAQRSGLCDVRFASELTGFDLAPDTGLVSATVSDRTTTRTWAVNARFLVAADGAASPIRDQLGIPTLGRTALGHYVNVHYRADLRRWTDTRRAVMYWVADAGFRGVFQPLDGEHRWLSQITCDGRAETFAAFDAARCREWIRTAVGDPTLDVEVLGIGQWTMNATVAERFSAGPVFLVGDAAQQMPPTGGFGVNTGIQGAHNLAWKLALVLADRAAPELLRSYEQERLPVSRFNTERSLANSRLVVRVGDAGQGTHPLGLDPVAAVAQTHAYGNFLGMELGHAYDSTVNTADGTAPPAREDEVVDYIAVARPGHRLPHLWLERAGTRMSTLDLIGRRLCLFALDDLAWQRAADHCADLLPMRVHALPDASAVRAQFGLDANGAVLVRPDGHVAARWVTAPRDAPALLRAAVARLLCREENA